MQSLDAGSRQLPTAWLMLFALIDVRVIDLCMDPKHTLLRIMTALMLLCFLSACGGQPTVRENMGQFNWNTGFGGGFVGYCQCGQTLWLFSVDWAERFDLSSKNGRLLKSR